MPDQWLDGYGQRRLAEVEAALREARKWVEHYGEPEGMSNCERNWTSSSIHEDELITMKPFNGPLRDCDCGASEALAKIDAVLGKHTSHDERGSK